MMIDKYVALKDEYEEMISWSCGMRHGNVDKLHEPTCHNYVSIWTPADGSRHTILGNDMDAMKQKCYDEFIDGNRNNVEPYPLDRAEKVVEQKEPENHGKNWFGKLFD